MQESGRGREMREKHTKCKRYTRPENRCTAQTRSQNGLVEAAGGTQVGNVSF